MKKLTIALILVLCNCSRFADQFPPSDLEMAIGKFWSDCPSMAMAIRYSESRNGTDRERNERTALTNQPWVKDYHRRKMLFARYGEIIYFSLGDNQVLFIGADSIGYRGTPYQLRDNIWTNMRWSKKIYDEKFRQYGPDLNNVVSAYNHGSPWKNKRGEFVNWRYVEEIMTNYNKWVKYEKD